MMEVIERDMETETETDTDEDMETDEPMVFEVTEIDLEYEFDAARWCDFTREESPLESRVAELWFETAQSYPPSPFAIKLLMMREEVSDEKTEPLSKSEDVRESDIDISQDQHCLATDVNETANEMKSGVFNFIQRGGELKNVPNESLLKGPTISNHVHKDKVKCRTKSSTRQIPRGSTLMKPTASQLAKLDNSRLRMQVDKTKEKGLFSSSGSEAQASKRQKLDGGLLRKIAEKTQEMNFVHKAVKKDRTLERNLQHGRTKTTVPQEPDFATSHRANRIRQKDDAKLDQEATSVYRFKARPFNRKIFEAPSMPIRKKSTPKLPEFQEFHLKTSERAMQHSSAVSTGNNYRKGSYKPDTKAFLDGVNREPRRPRAADIAKDNDRKHIFKARPLDNKIVSSRRDIGIFRKSKRETAVSLTQTREFSFRSQKKVQQDLPTDLFSKLSIKPELQPNNGSRLRSPQPEQVKGSKENRLNSFQAGNEYVAENKDDLWPNKKAHKGLTRTISTCGSLICFPSSSLAFRVIDMSGFTLPTRLFLACPSRALHRLHHSKLMLYCKMSSSSSSSSLTHSITLPSQPTEPVNVAAAAGVSSSDFRRVENAVDSSLFKNWLRNLESETGILADGTMTLKQVIIQGVDMFGERIGFLKFKADILDKGSGHKVPGIVFARGPAVAVLILLESDDGETYAVLTEQVRVPTGKIVLELPAGMLDDDEGDFVGTAVREVEEEIGIKLRKEEMVDLTAFLDPSTGHRIFPSPGGCDEEISVFLYRRQVEQETIRQLQGKETGLREHGEFIKVRLVPYRELWRKTADAKVLMSIGLYEMAQRVGLVPRH
ncbi:hypothetical protein HID58_086857 [Brassica napus]|uniref:Nudix hydrolase domain-containing protein n=1 Tax=Brassica napus TaxID=3708 RepID=A0ABQ7XU86_BRANA|nr:hypothetical protein HID58_086857 [Brassica napus]